MGSRRNRREPLVNGWIVIDKPSGPTSTQVLNRVKRGAHNTKAGHGGTLDPLATGVLPIALGEATKTVPFVMDGRKIYRFRLQWGEARDTDDSDGDVVATSPIRPEAAAVEAVLPRFVGEIEQVPPRFSAIKVAGQRAYDLARANEVVELKPRTVRIDRLVLVEAAADHVVLEVECGKGAYMRSLARDIALVLDTVGHVAALRRLRAGPFTLDQAIPLESVESLGHDGNSFEGLLPVETALADIPALAVSGSEAVGLRNGQPVPLFRKGDLDRVSDLAEGDTVRAESDGRIVALARFEAGRIRPVRILNV